MMRKNVSLFFATPCGIGQLVARELLIPQPYGQCLRCRICAFFCPYLTFSRGDDHESDGLAAGAVRARPGDDGLDVRLPGRLREGVNRGVLP